MKIWDVNFEGLTRFELHANTVPSSMLQYRYIFIYTIIHTYRVPSTKQQQGAVLTFSRQKHHHTYVYIEKYLDEALVNKSKPTRT